MGAPRQQQMRDAATAAVVSLAAAPLLLGAFTASVTTNLSYGGVARPDSGGFTVALNAASGARTGIPSGASLSAYPASRAVLALAGGPKNATYNVAITPTGITIGGNTTAFTWYSANGASGSLGLLNASGDDTLYIGGTCGITSTSSLGAQIASGALTVAVTTNGNPTRSVSATVPASAMTAQVAAPLALSKTTDLAFGTVVSGASAGTLTVPATAAPTPTTTGGVSYVGSAIAGKFALSGEPSQAYTLAVMPSTLTLNGPSGATMTANAFTTSPTSAATMPAGGNETIYVGGRLNVGASQAQGTYTGILTLTVAYQ